MLKQILAVVAGTVLGIAVFAADVELKDDHPEVYVVQKGDTLWDISARFLARPWLWPEIWQANPQIANPHLIYPGDRLTLTYIGGEPRLMLGGDGKLQPRVRRQPLDEAITAVPLSKVLPFLTQLRVLDESQVKRLPYVVALEENRLRSTTGQIAYVRGLDAPPGARVLIVRPTYVYTDVPDHFPWESSTRHVEAESWESERGVTIGRWWKGVAVNFAYRRQTEYLGHEVEEIGEAEVLRGGDPSTLLVHYGEIEIKKGDLVMSEQSMPFDLTFYPRAPDAVPDNMRVVAFETDSLAVVGPKQVVALSKGARDGVENGHVFSIFHPGDVIRDEVEYPEDDLRAFFKPSRARLELPEEFIGHVMVFRTFDKMSYGLVMDGVRPVHLYDVLHAPVN
jgi:hypothetical protein